MPALWRSDADTRDLLARLAVLYRIQLTGELIGVLPSVDDQRFIEPLVSRMDVEELLDPSGDGVHLALTQRGQQVLAQLVEVFDRTIPLNIFARVYIERELDRGITDEEGRLYGNVFDPRFGDPNESTTDELVDMRLAMLSYLAEHHSSGRQQRFDPYVVVFLHKLMDGELESPRFWQNLRAGAVLQDIKDIIDSAKTWRSMDPDEAVARARMQGLYTAGMVETRKREGAVCSACESPLAIFEEEAQTRGEPLEACPGCGHVFQTVSRDTVVETVVTGEEYWTGGYEAYGYSPVGPYGYDYPAGLFISGMVLGAILL